MRILVSLALAITATLLFSHGLFHDEPAMNALVPAEGLPSRDDLVHVNRTWPYTEAAVEARLRLLRLEAQGTPPESGRAPFFEAAAERIEDGLSERPPFLDPFAASVLGLLGIALAAILPRTRFRGIALLGILLGLVAVAPAFLGPADQAGLICKVGFAEMVIARLPWTAIGLLLLGSLLVGFQRPPARED